MSTRPTDHAVDALRALWAGDLNYLMPAGDTAESAAIAEEHNRFLERLRLFAGETTRIADEVAEGKFGGQAEVENLDGVWKDLIDRINHMGATLTDQIRSIAHTTSDVGHGRFTRKVEAPCQGEMLELKQMINTMVDQLNCFAYELTRLVREVGTEGVLGPQVDLPGAQGTWKDLIDNVNVMSAQLTVQLRSMGAVAGALASGDVSARVTVNARGETLALIESLNRLADRLASSPAS